MSQCFHLHNKIGCVIIIFFIHLPISYKASVDSICWAQVNQYYNKAKPLGLKGHQHILMQHTQCSIATTTLHVHISISDKGMFHFIKFLKILLLA